MVSDSFSGWRARIGWWSVVGFATAGALVTAAALSSREENGLLAIAILAALPWSLCLLALDLVGGFSAWAAMIVSLGLCLNGAVIWSVARAWRAHRHSRRTRE